MTRRAFFGVCAAAVTARGQGKYVDLIERMTVPGGRVSVVLDTDQYNEVDDQFALAYAVRSPERIDLEAVYAGPFKNSRAATAREGMERSYDEIVKVLGLLGEDRPTLRGSTRYLNGPNDRLESPAVHDLIERAMAPRESPLWVVGLGCPTNIAAATILEPRIVDRIVVLWIGGQLRGSSGAGDFNMAQDYHASRMLYDSGVALVNVPGYLVSEQMRTTTLELDRYLAGKSKIGSYLAEIVRQYERERRACDDCPWTKPIWDLATIGLLVNPEWFRTQMEPSPTLLPDLTWGPVDHGRHPVRVVWHVDRDAVFGDVFSKLSR